MIPFTFRAVEELELGPKWAASSTNGGRTTASGS